MRKPSPRDRKPTGSFFRHNRQIRISPVRLIDQDDNQVGVIPTEEALRMAQDAGLDLVEVAPQARPPVCRILDYGKWKYQQQKKEDKQRAAARHSSLKEVKIRTTKIDQHDLMIKVNNAKKFLEQGHKVQFVLQYRGREMAHQELGREIFGKVKRELFYVGKVEQDMKMMGRRISMVLAPENRDPNKVALPEPDEYIGVSYRPRRIGPAGEIEGEGEGAPAPAKAPARSAAPRPAARQDEARVPAPAGTA